MADENLSAKFVTNHKIADQADIEAWARSLQPTPLGPPSPQPGQQQAEKKPEGPTTLPGKVIGAMKDTVYEGAHNFIAGLMNRPKSMFDVEGHGQALMGVLQMLNALPAGAGAAARHAVENWLPYMDDKTVVIPGGQAGENSPAFILRAILSAPGVVLDPATRKAMLENPYEASKIMNQPMTAGELTDAIVQMVAMPWAGRMMGKVISAGKGPSGPLGPAGGPGIHNITPPGYGAVLGPPPRPRGPGSGMAPVLEEMKALPPASIITDPPQFSGSFETRARAAQMAGPEEYARFIAMELRDVLKDAPTREPTLGERIASAYAKPTEAAAKRPYEPGGGPTLIEGQAPPPGFIVDPQGRTVPAGQVGSMADREQLRVMNRTPLGEPSATTPESSATTPVPGATEPPGPSGSLASALDRALTRSQQIIEEEYNAIKGEVAGPTKPKTLQDYKARKPGFGFDDLSVPEQDAAFTTLEMMQEQAKNAEPGQRFLQTDEYGKVEGVTAQRSTYPEFMDSLGIKRTRQNADRLVDVIEKVKKGEDAGDWGRRVIEYVRGSWGQWASKYGYHPEGGGPFGGQKGQVDTMLLARMALGAAAGGTQGDTAEERIRNALAGMGLAAFAPSIAKKIVNAYKESGLANEAGALDWAKFRSKRPAVQQSEQPYQPNYDRLNITPDTAAVMKQVHRLMKEDILERRGPARSNDKRVTEAIDMIQTGKMTPERVLTLSDQEMLTDSEITAARMLSIRATQLLKETAVKVLNNDPSVPEGAMADHLAVSGAMGRNVRVAQTRIAQAQQASSIRVQGEGAGYRPEDVAHLADEIGAGKSNQQIAAMLADMKTPQQMGRLSAWLTLFPKMLLQGIYFSYLSGKAAPRNAIGNGTMMAIAPVERGIGRFMPLWGSTKPGIMAGEATQMLRALGDSFVDHVMMFRHLEQMEAAARKSGVDLSVYKSERRGPAGKAFLQEAGVENERLLSMGQWYDNVTTFPGEVLDRTDIISKTLNANMAHRLEAFRQARGEFTDPVKFEQRFGELLDDVTKLNDAARQRINDFAQKQTFTQEFEGKMLKILAQGPDNEWANLGYRSFIMPFFRVTARMGEATLERTPGLNFLLKGVRDDWMAGGVQRQMVQARMVSGAAIVGSFMYLESQGMITGNAPKDPFKRSMWEQSGHVERSWWDPLSEKWRSYDGFGPLTSLIAGAADTSVAMRMVPEQTATSLYEAFVISQLNSLDSRTFTQQPSAIMDVIKNPRPDAQVEAATALLRRQVAGWLKPGLVREIESMGDPEIRRVLRSGEYAEGSWNQEWHAWLDDIRAGWPSWSSEKDAEGNYLVPPDRDRLTGDYMVGESWPFNPFPGRTPKTDLPVTIQGRQTTVRQEIERLNYAGLEGWPEWVGGTSPSPENVGMTTPNPRAGVRLTLQERDRFAELLTQVVKDGNGDTYAKALQRLMASPDYAEQSEGTVGTDGGKALAIRNVDNMFHKMAEEQLYAEGRNEQGQPGALERKVLSKQAGRQIELVPTSQQGAVRQSVQETLKNLRLPNTLTR